VIHTTDLRAQRHTTGHSLAAAAHQLGTWPSTISAIERGHAPHHHLAPAYRNWLNTQQPAA
jgi:transcriptional regulator with XRE-family HTH domain